VVNQNKTTSERERGEKRKKKEEEEKRRNRGQESLCVCALCGSLAEKKAFLLEEERSSMDGGQELRRERNRTVGVEQPLKTSITQEDELAISTRKKEKEKGVGPCVLFL
jgi:hypothetical protein